MSSGAGGQTNPMKLTHGHLVTSEMGVSIELFSRSISGCGATGEPDMVLRLPDDVLEAAAGTSIPARVESGNKEAPNFGHPNGGALIQQTTTLTMGSISGGRLRGELRSQGTMTYHSITKGEEFAFRASGTIDVPICD